MTRRTLTKIEQLFLNSPTCLFWPRCGCFQTITYWQELLEDLDEVFTLEELEAGETVICFSLACAAEHCRDPATKEYAQQQFRNLSLRRQRIAAAPVKKPADISEILYRAIEPLKERKDA